MNKIEWKDEYSVGVDELDEQHKKIIAMINLLNENQSEKSQVEVVRNVLIEMMKYSKYHLDYEEGLLAQNDYPDYKNHKNSHLDYMMAYSSLSIEIMKHEKDQVPKNLLDFLNNWWTHHILVEDMKYKPFFQEKGIS